uniref:Ig-like domain-containing protein n=1 Tax=uncultured Methanobrevibacter sp. TaxID=253161 RepID=UPI0025F4E92C
MKYNKYFMVVLSIFLILFVFIGSASAADANGTDILSANDNNEIISTTIDNNEILTTGNDVSNYSELSREIAVGGQIELQHDYYKYDSGNTINIPNDCFIDGKGAVIDMAGSSIRAFIINGSNVIINNLTIKNVYSEDEGGAFYSEIGGIVTNCNFINNSAGFTGGAISFINVTGSVANCNFINNSAAQGSAVCFWDVAGNVTNCTFTDNNAASAGALYLCGGIVSDCTFSGNSNDLGRGGAIASFTKVSNIVNCTFTDNSGAQGGAIAFYDADCNVTGCTFIGNAAIIGTDGGAIWTGGGNVTNCTFIDNSGAQGGAISFYGYCIVTDCTFLNNTARGQGSQFADGGAIHLADGIVTNCNFINNSGEIWGGAISSAHVTVNNCTFTGNTITGDTKNMGGHAIYSNTGGSVTNCVFVDNSAESIKYTIYSAGALYDSLDNNWWGSNDPDWDELISYDQIPSIYAVFKASAEPGEIGAGGKSDIITKFIWNGTNTDATNSLPKRHVNLSSKGNLTETFGDVGLISAFYANDEDTYEVKAVVDNEKRTVEVKVSGSANSTDIFVNATSLNLTVGETGSINATLNPLEAGILIVDYDKKIIRIDLDSDGKWIVTGLAEGNTNITFSFPGSGQFTPAESKTVNVTVSLNDARVAVNNNTLDLEIGDTFVINATTMPEGLNVTYVGDDSGVYKVDENGVVTALTNGTGSILVKVGGDGVYAENSTTVTVTVSKVPTEINITNETVDLKANGEVPTGATLTPADAGNLTYTSSNSGVAIVENGKIKGIRQGEANITVSFAGDDKYIAAENKTIAVSVSLADACVTVNNDTLDLKVGDTFVINATTSPEGLDVTYVQDESGVYSVDENGVVTALTNGTGSILVKVGGDGVYAENSTTVTVTVSLKDASVVADRDSLDLLVGETGKFYASTDPEDLDITVSSSNESVATVKLVNRVPTVTAVGEGSAVITLTINEKDYVKNSTTVNVKVVKIPTEILIQNDTLDMIVGDIVDPVVSLMPSDAGNMSFIVSDVSVILVNGHGFVKAVGEGNATVTVRFGGNDKYLPSNATITVTVRDALIVTALDVVKYYGGPERFVVNVTDGEGNPLSNKSVTIVINKVTYNRTTDENVDNKTVNSVVTVLTTVNGTDVVKMYKNDTQYYATFIDSEGKYLADGTTVKFNINGVMYERKVSGGKGQAKLNINLPAGKYVITAMNPKTGEKESNNIVVLATIVENRDITKYYKNATQYTVKVLGADGNPVGAGKTVTFNINGV